MAADQRSGRSGSSYYAVLGVAPDASFSEIRTAYRKLAMKWHPDRCGRQSGLVEEAKRRFQQIQEAYQVLSDEGKRTLYDAGLYDPSDKDEEVEGFFDFVQEMLNLMSNVRREEKECTLEELQGMLAEMIQSYDSLPLFSSQSFGFEENNSSKGANGRQSNVRMSGLEAFGGAVSYG